MNPTRVLPGGAKGVPLVALPRALHVAFLALLAMLVAWPAAARAADDDLPGRVGRVANVAGELFLAPQERPDQWTPIGLNYPVAAGDNVWAGRDGRAEIDIGAGQFRLAGDTSVLLARLDDRQFALFIAQGMVSIRVRVLDPGETAQVDTPNAQVVLTRPGLYRVEVAKDRQSTVVAVREGEVNVHTGSAVAQVLPGQTATVEGAQPTSAAVANGIATDGFDQWAASRERYYDRSRTASYVSRQMVGWADLEEYGTWEQLPEYGAVWYPSAVAADWAPYRNGYWTEVGAWGPTWVDYAPWGYAPFHYGRWAHIRGRWGWCPGAYVARPAWAPALVGWAGGPGWTVSASYGAPVYGWVPLGWGEAYRPGWRRCSQGCWERYNRPYAVDPAQRPGSSAPVRYVNANLPGGMTAMAGATLLTRKPVHANRIDVGGGMLASAPLLPAAPIMRPEPGRIPGRVPGNGTPPPASTFYPTMARPGGPASGMGALPDGAAGVGVMAPRRSSPVPAPSAFAPSGMMRPTPITAPGAGTGGMGGAAAGNTLLRSTPTAAVPPVAGAAAVAPPLGMDTRPVVRPGPSVSLAPAVVPPAVYAPAPAGNALRPVPRPQGMPLPPPTLAAPPPQLLRPAPAPAQSPLSRAAPEAPTLMPVAPAGRPAPAPAPGGEGALSRSRNAGSTGSVPVPDRPR